MTGHGADRSWSRLKRKLHNRAAVRIVTKTKTLERKTGFENCFPESMRPSSRWRKPRPLQHHRRPGFNPQEVHALRSRKTIFGLGLARANKKQQLVKILKKEQHSAGNTGRGYR